MLREKKHRSGPQPLTAVVFRRRGARHRIHEAPSRPAAAAVRAGKRRRTPRASRTIASQAKRQPFARFIQLKRRLRRRARGRARSRASELR